MTADLSAIIARLEDAEVGSRELQERILANVEYDTAGGCWLWSGSAPKGRQLRGYITVDGRSRLASRTSFQAFTGIDPAGGMVCHKCDVPTCVNPDHLYLGDHKSNMADMKNRRRYFAATQPDRCREAGVKSGKANTWAKGVMNPKAKLSDDQVNSIRIDVRPTKIVAGEYGVDRTTVQRIRRGALWAALRAKQEPKP